MSETKKVDYFSTFQKTLKKGSSDISESFKSDILLLLDEFVSLDYGKMVEYLNKDPKRILYELKNLRGNGLVDKQGNKYKITTKGKRKINK